MLDKDPLLLRTLRKERVERPPVWLMRQAGRYLPEYMVLREKYDFFTRVETPELASEITLQPIDIVGPDAAIIFSDILIIPKAMGMEVQLIPKVGPLLPQPLATADDIAQLQTGSAEHQLKYLYDALSITRAELSPEKALIGFSGAPWTLMCYMIEGQGSKTFSKAKAFLYQKPEESALLLDTLTDYIIEMLLLQIKAGADLVQVFDSWSGLLGPDDFDFWIFPRLKKIVDAVSPHAPVIVFAKGSWYSFEKLSSLNAALGLDWCISPEQARTWAPNSVLQGNLDPSVLLSPEEEVVRSTKKMLDDFGTQNYIANLGHGLMPNIPVQNVRTFINTIKGYGS